MVDDVIYLPYLHNVCYGPTHQVSGFKFGSAQNFYVSSIFAQPFWYYTDGDMVRGMAPVIRDDCDSSVSFKNYANDYYYSPPEKKYKNLDSITEHHILSFDCDESQIIEIPLPEPDKPDDEDDDGNEPEKSPSTNSSVSNVTTTTTPGFEIITDEPVKSTSLLFIVLIVIAVIEVILITALIIIIILKSKEEESTTDAVELDEENIAAVKDDILVELTTNNTLFCMKYSDDPFSADFNEKTDEFVVCAGKDLEKVN
ncbi:hypothetical protein TVAG_478670 [Trichomonas vaginalis G3]|uniref:Uncharacterized protein n=1 Tax=Trichomonas vaginalis (strain ATCC PRA-98 / G3) TaxID=412133 RepID=A2DZY3_TRIV3|nr:leucine-rich repeats (6 copies)-containing protein [Trichomonas vaginalis G3]EAY14042.1 hypothetical protein TVAG_478670 [Trichomonas vaginalis G3]KAI5519516.1 leucine-rich repeats (6 copies)-containing protein [Trichomonas vaginalis G3]|eukprot:XP_001326265.1 hypothetical protein [Trichomonas vaginalis G3]